MEAQGLIHSIYRGTEGEGLNIGLPQVFVRYQGCRIGCLNCDSKETWSFDEGEKLKISEIIERVREQGPMINRVSITGGDPLHPQSEGSVFELSKALKELNYHINIEASGTRVVPKIFEVVDFISFDCKTPSTGVLTPKENLIALDQKYASKSQIKSVIADERDFKFVFDLRSSLQDEHELETPWILTPSFESHQDFNPELSKKIMELNYQSGSPFRVIGQQHKFIFGASELRV